MHASVARLCTLPASVKFQAVKGFLGQAADDAEHLSLLRDIVGSGDVVRYYGLDVYKRGAPCNAPAHTRWARRPAVTPSCLHKQLVQLRLWAQRALLSTWVGVALCCPFCDAASRTQTLTRAALRLLLERLRSAADGASAAEGALRTLAQTLCEAQGHNATLVAGAVVAALPIYTDAAASARKEDEQRRLQAGEPLLALLNTNALGRPQLVEALSSIAAAVADPHREDASSTALMRHVAPVFVATALSGGAVAAHATSLLTQLGASRASTREHVRRALRACVRLCGADAECGAVAALMQAVACGGCSGDETCSDGASSIALATLGLLLRLADAGRPHVHVAWTLQALLRASPEAGSALSSVVRAAMARPSSLEEAALLTLVAVCGEVCSEEGWAADSSIACLQPQLLSHLACPSDGELHAVSAHVLCRVRGSSFEQQAPLSARVGFLSSVDVEACMSWLKQLSIDSLASLPATQRRRSAAAHAALLQGRLWPGAVPVADDVHLAAQGAPGHAFRLRYDVLAILASLSQHTEVALARAAAAALCSCAVACPNGAAGLLPWCLDALHRSIAIKGPKERASADADALVHAALLPAICAAPALEAAFSGVVAQLLDDSAPADVRALGMRMLLAFWQLLNRGWKALCNAILALGPAAPGTSAAAAQDTPATVRRAAAAATAAVARSAPDKCLAVVSVVGGCLQDEDAVVAALGFEALAALCAAVRSDRAQAVHMCSARSPQLT